MQNSVIRLSPAQFFPGRLVTVELFVEFQLPNFFRLAGRARTSFHKKANFLNEKVGSRKSNNLAALMVLGP